MSKNVVVGSGISGLFACLYLVNKGIRNILIIEQSKQTGGALKSYDYGEYGKFDQGMHNILLPGITGLDELLLPFVTTQEWNPLSGNNRDLCGVYWNDKLQTESPYPQIFRLPDSVVAQGLRDFFSAVASGVGEVSSAAEYFDLRFGKTFAEKIFYPIVEKIHKKPANELHYSAASIVPLNRISLDNNKFSEVVLQNNSLRSVIAWPDQRSLPLNFSSGRNAYYPRKYGMYHLIDEIVEYLKKNGCEIITSSKVLSMSAEQGRISEVTIEKDGERQNVSTENVIWSAGQIPLLKSLNISLSLPFERAQKTYVANLILKTPPRMGDLYYAFIYDQQYKSFRITNYKTFSPECDRAGGVPVSVEILSDSELTSDGIIKLAMEELTSMGLTNHDELIWAKGEHITEGGFPLPSNVNVNSIGKIRDLIDNAGFTNLLNIGIQSTKDTFFQTDVLVDSFHKLERVWK